MNNTYNLNGTKGGLATLISFFNQKNKTAVPEKFEYGVLNLKTYQMFSAHTMPEKFENTTKSAFEKLLSRWITCRLVWMVDQTVEKSSCIFSGVVWIKTKSI